MEEYKKAVETYVQELKTNFLPGLEFGFVIFGFHDGQLKVLLTHLPFLDKWVLPGGRIGKKEDLKVAADRSLQLHTGLEKIFLKQFQIFGKAVSSPPLVAEDLLDKLGLTQQDVAGLPDRDLTLGYYALVEYTKVNPTPSALSDECRWWNLDEVPHLLFDQNEMIQVALKTLRRQLSYNPAGYNLLPETFTMTELQSLYETILGRSLNRRNFYKQMMNDNILERLEERKFIGAHKAPYLYRFSKESYYKAIEEESIFVV